MNRLKRYLAVLLVMAAVILLLASCAKKTVITYSLYPYLPDCEYYCSVIEDEWKKVEPDVELRYVDYNCYLDGEPEGIDVIMYDSLYEDALVEAGYIQPIDDDDIEDAQDYFDYVLEDTRKEGKLYGIPAILCSEFLIYDKASDTAADAECVEDMAPIKDRFLVNTDLNYINLYKDYLADKSGVYEPDRQDFEIDETALDYVKAVSNKDYQDVLAGELSEAYREGKCDAFLGYSENMCNLGDRFEDTWIKTISMTEDENIPLYFADIVGLSSEVDTGKKEKCLKLMNLISSSDVMKKIAVKAGEPSYLIFPRESFYEEVTQEYPLYDHLYEFVKNPANHIYR